MLDQHNSTYVDETSPDIESDYLSYADCLFLIEMVAQTIKPNESRNVLTHKVRTAFAGKGTEVLGMQVQWV